MALSVATGSAMTFGLPEALLGLLILPVLLWLTAARPARVDWPSLLAWPAEGRDITRHRRGLPKNWPVLAAVAILIGALARPQWRGTASRASIGIVVDRSASLAARRASGAPRFAALRESLAAHLQALPEGDAVRVWPTPAGIRPDEATDEQTPRSAERLLRSLEPVSAADDLEEAVERALKARASGEVDSIWIASDRLPEGIEDGGTDRGSLAVTLAGDDAPNDGIVFGCVAERESGLRVLAAVTRTGGPRPPREVTLDADGSPRGSKQLGVGDDEPVAFDLASEEVAGATVLRLRLTGSDALGADDEFSIARLPPGCVRASLFGTASPALRRALQAEPSVALVETPPADVAFCHRVAPPAGKTPWVSFDAPPGDGHSQGEPVDVLDLRTADTALDFEGLHLEGVAILRARGIRGGSPEVLASTAAGPVCVASRRGPNVEIGFALDEGGWPQDPSFPLFIRRVVLRAGGSGRQAGWHSFWTGEEIQVSARDAEVARLTDFQNRTQDVRATDGFFRIRSLSCGFVRFAIIGTGNVTGVGNEWVYPVNLASVRETLLGRTRGESEPDHWLRHSGGHRPSETDLRPAFCVAAMALLCVGWRPSRRASVVVAA